MYVNVCLYTNVKLIHCLLHYLNYIDIVEWVLAKWIGCWSRGRYGTNI